MTAPDRPETISDHEPETTPQTSTPEAAQDHTGSDHATHGANTNLDPHLQGGPVTPADRAATQDIEDRNAAPDSPNLKGS